MLNEQNRARMYELLIEELEDFAIFLIDPQGTIISWNPGVKRFFGYDEKEFVGKPFIEIFTPEDRAAKAHQEEMDRARQDGRSSDIRWHLCSDRSRVFVEGVLTCIKDESGNHCGFSKIARAVRPQHAAGSLIATLLEGTDDAIYATDKSGRFVFANTAAASLLGRSVDEVISHTHEEVLPAAIASDLRATDQSVMSSNHARLVEEKFPSERGERVLLATKTPWRDSQDGLIGLLAISKDITNRAALQNEREQLFREVRRANRELSDFSHVVAHDLRTPLRAVRTYAELLSDHLEPHLDATSRQFLTFVTEGAQSMEQLIESLLHYAESGGELSLTRVNISAVIAGLLHRLEPLVRETGATIVTEALPEVYADPVRLLQVFQNLIVNAINYRSSEAPRIRIFSETRPEEYLLGVSDNGVGISREYLEQIFVPLKRLHSKAVAGHGLGLALCKKIVESHRGRIWAESTQGSGSTFFFTLPRGARDSAAERTRAS
ncbi:MAG TPA: PAS domain-containing protein [Bryobacteraceae bacterium]|nr:PAS domain-containing protein [Bryobacteraceae bacterium]